MKIPCDAIQKNLTGIYIIRNNINNKVYIGQSTDIKRRWQEHLRSAQPDKYAIKSIRDSKTPIHLAMQKYGIKNFQISILENCCKEELNEKERFWIEKFQSTNKNIGYNILKGGQDSLGVKGEYHSQAKLTLEQVCQIRNLLKENSLSLKEISILYNNISTSTLSMINTGKVWKDENIEYPLRMTYTGSKGSKNPRSCFTEEQVMEIRTLYSQGVTLKNIPDKYKKLASESAITAILYGRSYKHLPIWSKKEQKWIEPCIDYSQS